MRTVKKKHPKHYLEGQGFIQEDVIVSQKDSLFEFMLNALRLQDKISWALLEERSGWQKEAVLAYCDKLVSQELMEYNEESFSLTAKGKLFTNEAVSVFLPE